MLETIGEISVVVHAPAQTVYDYLLDFTRHSEWVYNLSKVSQVSQGPIGVGTIFRAQEGPPPVSLIRKLNMMIYFIKGLTSGAKPYSEAEITGLEPGRRIAWRAGIPKGAGFFNLAEWEFILESRGQDTCVRQRFRYLPQTPAAERMVGAAGEGGIERACAASLERLKLVLEQSVALAA
jgi:uncharacterized membrane protein